MVGNIDGLPSFLFLSSSLSMPGFLKIELLKALLKEKYSQQQN
jgi:hypothetical protein